MIAEPETDIAQREEDLIDLGDENKPQHKALQRTATGEVAANGSASDKGKPNPTLRRTSSILSVTKDGQPKPLTNVDHFRHLGPSNLASRPRQTRYNTIPTNSVLLGRTRRLKHHFPNPTQINNLLRDAPAPRRAPLLQLSGANIFPLLFRKRSDRAFAIGIFFLGFRYRAWSSVWFLFRDSSGGISLRGCRWAAAAGFPIASGRFGRGGASDGAVALLDG